MALTDLGSCCLTEQRGRRAWPPGGPTELHAYSGGPPDRERGTSAPIVGANYVRIPDTHGIANERTFSTTRARILPSRMISRHKGPRPTRATRSFPRRPTPSLRSPSIHQYERKRKSLPSAKRLHPAMRGLVLHGTRPRLTGSVSSDQVASVPANASSSACIASSATSSAALTPLAPDSLASSLSGVRALLLAVALKLVPVLEHVEEALELHHLLVRRLGVLAAQEPA